MRILFVAFATLSIFANSAPVEDRLAALEAAVRQLQQQVTAKDGKINSLTEQLAHYQEEEQEDHAHCEHAAHGVAEENHDYHAGHGEEQVTVSGVLNVAVGGGDEAQSVMEKLQAGAHDPRKRGFNLQQFELAVNGEVGPFEAQSYVIFREDGVELEEAFVTTEVGDLDLKLGYFFTEFGRINPGHLETWDFLDQPVVNSRLFGGEGTRGSGLRLGWHGFSLTAQNSDDQALSFRGEPGGHAHGEEEEKEEFPAGFGEEGIGGRSFHDSEVGSMDDLMYTLRWGSQLPVGKLGISTMWGRNGHASDTATWIYGLDYRVAADNGRWSWQTEIMKREYHTNAVALFDDLGTPDPSDDINIDLPAETLEDWGIYTQFLYNMTDAWGLGVRYDYASGTVDSAEGGQLFDRNLDPARGDRSRISPLLTYRPTQRTRLRLQYNLDDADFLPDGRAHGIWLGFEVTFGDHPDH